VRERGYSNHFSCCIEGTAHNGRRRPQSQPEPEKPEEDHAPQQALQLRVRPPAQRGRRRPGVKDRRAGLLASGQRRRRPGAAEQQQLHLHHQVQRGHVLAQVPLRAVPPGCQHLLPPRRLPRLHKTRPLRLLNRHRAARHRHPRHHGQGGHRGLEEVPAGPYDSYLFTSLQMQHFLTNEIFSLINLNLLIQTLEPKLVP
jgi:hypothetical protein